MWLDRGWFEKHQAQLTAPQRRRRPLSRTLCQSVCALSILLSSVGVWAQQAVKPTRVLRMAHTLDQQHVVHKSMEFLASRIDELSHGQMQLRIYPGGQLGSERELIELLQIGSLAMTKVSAAPLEGFSPNMKLFSVPYVFRDESHLWQVLEGPIGQQMLADLDKVRLKGLGYFDAGARSFYTTQQRIDAPSDLKGLKFRVPNSQTAVQMVQTLGGAATPVDWGELYTALQQGVVDGAENNPPSFFSSRHYEISKYYVLDEHTYVPDVILMSKHVWDSLSADEQQIVSKAFADAVVFERAAWHKATADALAAVQKAGVTVIIPDKAQFMAAVQPLHQQLQGTPIGDLMAQIKALGGTQ